MKNKSVPPDPPTCPGCHSPVAWGQERLCREEAVCSLAGLLLPCHSRRVPGGRGPHTPFSKAPGTGALAAPALDLGADW